MLDTLQPNRFIKTPEKLCCYIFYLHLYRFLYGVCGVLSPLFGGNKRFFYQVSQMWQLSSCADTVDIKLTAIPKKELV